MVNPGFMQILQSSPQAILNWNQFNIGLGETVRFLQPGTQAAILNRVTGTDPSLIQGMLQGNGRVFLLNPNGILFGPNSVVDVGSFMASTLKMSDADFLNGTFKLTQDRSLPLAAITNQGQIHVADGGFVVLTSPLLDNQGLIVAQSGTVHLGATTQATFSVDGRGQIQFVMPDGFNPQFTGGGQGGTVLLQPGQMSTLLGQVVNNPGLVEAGSFKSGSNGQTLALGAEGVLLNSGTIQADGGTVRLDSSQTTVHSSAGVINALNGDARVLSDGSTVSLGSVNAAGGFVEISGEQLGLYGPVSAHTVLLDPTNLQIINGAASSQPGDADVLAGNPPAASFVSTGAIIAVANVLLQADNDVTYTRTGGGFDLVGAGTTLSVIAGHDIVWDLGNVNIELAALSLLAGHDVRISNISQIKTDGGPISMTATTGDIVLSSGFNMSFASTPGHQILLDAGRDVSISVPAGRTLDEASTAMNVTAGHDFFLVSDFLGQSFGNELTIDATRNVDIRSNTGDIMNYNVAGLNVSAGGTLSVHSDGSMNVGTNPGNLRLVSAGALQVDSGSSLTLSSLGTTTLGGSSISLFAPSALAVNGNGGLTATSTNGNLHVNSLSSTGLTALSGPINMQSTGGDILLSSAGGALDVRAAGTTQVNSSNNLTLQTPVGQTTHLDGTPTTLHADNDVDLRTTAFTGGNHPIIVTAGGNVTFNPGVSSNLDFSQTQSLAVTAGRDIVASVPNLFLITTNGGDQTLSAGRNLTVTSGNQQQFITNGGRISWQGGSVNSTSGSTQDWRGDGISIVSTGLNGTNGNVTLVNNGAGGDISLNSANANVNVTSAHDLTITAPSQVTIKSSPSSGVTTLNAAHDLQITTGNGQVLTLGGTTANLTSGNDLTLTSDRIRGDGAASTALLLQSGHDLLLRNTGNTGGLDVQSTSINATAIHDLIADGGPSLLIAATDGDLRLRGDRNLSLTTTGNMQVGASGALVLQGGNVTSNDGSGTVFQGNSGSTITATSGNVNLHTNGNTLRVNSLTGPTMIGAAGNVILVEPQNLVLAGTTVAVQATNGNVDLGTGPGRAFDPTGPLLVSAGGNVTYTGASMGSFDKINIRTTNGNVTLQSLPGDSLAVDTAGLNITAGNDLTARADANVNLNSSSGTDMELAAGRNLTVQAPAGAVSIQASNGNVRMTGQNVTVQALNSSAIKSALGTGTTLTVTATAGNVDLQATGSGSSFDLGADGGAVLSASGVLGIRSGGTSIGATHGNVTLRGDGGIDTSGAVLTINGQGTRILSNSGSNFAPGSVATATSAGVDGNSGQDLDLTNLRLNVLGGNVTLNANRNLKVGNVQFSSIANATFTGGNVTVDSMQHIGSGNLTITTPGNLTETTSATNPVTLAGLNITAGQIHNLNNTADNVSFSIPNTASPSNLNVTVTGGNDTLVPSAANLRNFNGSNVQPVSTPNQTGDVYVDGVLRTAGLPPLPPPPTPDPPPPSQPAPPILLNPGLTPEERSQILAQSNLALGNLGSFSRVLSDTERDRFTARMDSLHYNYNQDPFSPTLALVVPGGPPPVSAKELAELESMLGIDIGAAVNTMLAQELGFIWEVRYWRHLTERLVLWEDRE